MQGIDVSHHNGIINWDKVKKAGKEFVFVRIGWSGYEGEIHKDKRFEENVKFINWYLINGQEIKEKQTQRIEKLKTKLQLLMKPLYNCLKKMQV